MVVPERIVRACSGDREAAELIWETLAAVRLLREEGRTPASPTPAGDTSPAPLSEQPLGEPVAASPTGRVNPGSPNGFSCPNCLREWPEPFCDECGQRLEVLDTTGAPS